MLIAPVNSEIALYASVEGMRSYPRPQQRLHSPFTGIPCFSVAAFSTARPRPLQSRHAVDTTPFPLHALQSTRTASLTFLVRPPCSGDFIENTSASMNPVAWQHSHGFKLAGLPQ